MAKRHVGFTPIPKDADIAEFLQNLIKEQREELGATLKQLYDTIEQTHEAEEPTVFAFAKLLNFLASLEKPELVRLLSAALWEGYFHNFERE